MNFRWLNALFWGNSVALAWMWGLGLFFSVQITFMFGLQGLLLFAVPNALGLSLFGWLTQVVANRHAGGPESLATFFEKFARPFRLILFLYQVVALTLTVFALTKYLFWPLDLVSGPMTAIYLGMVVFVVLAAGCLFGEEFGIQRIKFGHGLFGAVVLLCIAVILFHLKPLVPENLGWGPADAKAWGGPTMAGFVIPLVIGLLVGPWLDLQHWQRAIQIHRERTSIRASYLWGGLIFFLLLLFHGCLAAWVLHKTGVADYGNVGLDKFRYAHQLVVQYIEGLPPEAKGLLPAAYFTFLGICVLTTLDSGYIALKWFLGNTIAKSQNVLVGMLPKRLLDSPIPTFFLVAFVTLVGLVARLELEYFMVFYASFFVGYAALAIARCFVPNSQQPLPQIRMFSLASISLVVFAFGYCTGANLLLVLGSVLPLVYVVWLVVNTDLLRVVTAKAGEVIEAAAHEIPAIKTITKTASAIGATHVTAPLPADAHSLSGHFEGKWFVYSFIATYQDTNSVGNVYFGMYGLFVGKTRELFFDKAMPDFDLKTTKFYILTRSFEHKFVREAREFDVITVKIRVADFNRKFCTLEHQIFGSENELLGKGKQSLLFVSSKDYSLLDIPGEVYNAFVPYV
ncbi:MAG: acyl-CoA thioesterase [Verrucomicrobiae bacterium]|nr:acyl-CoA thioesterase [Verrucomicrobiae bacterium]MCP5534118.1 acyl-CoA thioesterase [Akkermansiaceae bacterium]MCP5545189.1 acyl-CoA thioesterase [Akkermansiaceae bacterium]MCP5546904.1 acyl-CoA thioesterase [Akkermansiaceae bacterium]